MFNKGDAERMLGWYSVTDGVWASCPRPCHHFFRFFYFPFHLPLRAGSSSCCPTVNLFHQPPPMISTWDWRVVSVDNSLYRLHCHRWDSNPRPSYVRPLQVSPTANWGDLTHPHGKPGYCGYDNILELHGENVGPQPGQRCAADKSRNVHPGCPSQH